MTPERKASFVEALVEAGADSWFKHEGLLYFCVPLWIVRAYVEARATRADVTTALAVAAFGQEMVRECRAHPKVMVWTLTRAWVARLGELERKARGLGGGPILAGATVPRDRSQTGPTTGSAGAPDPTSPA